MKYIKAQKVLPNEVIEIIQKYIDGEFIYIPRIDGRQKAWGEKSGARDSLKERNNQIFNLHKDGRSATELSQYFYLSEQSIRRIISKEKAHCSNSINNHL